LNFGKLIFDRSSLGCVGGGPGGFRPLGGGGGPPLGSPGGGGGTCALAAIMAPERQKINNKTFIRFILYGGREQERRMVDTKIMIIDEYLPVPALLQQPGCHPKGKGS